jgi:phage-related protein
MSNIYIGFLLGFVAWLTVFGLVTIAHVRLSRLERGLRDIDWQVLSDLTLDVAKLKKSAQKWQNNENAAQKMSHQEMLQQALIEHQMQNQTQTTPRLVER